MASHIAARAAAKAGYRKVFVMPDGIEGWLKAGKRIERSTS
jgi:rhodanese-related sulfurtransferase